MSNETPNAIEPNVGTVRRHVELTHEADAAVDHMLANLGAGWDLSRLVNVLILAEENEGVIPQLLNESTRARRGRPLADPLA